MNPSSSSSSSSSSSATATAAPPDPWLQAFADPVAGLHVFSQSLRLIDLSGDGDFRLLAADLDRKLKVFRGTGVSSVHPLLDQPVAAAVFYPDAAVPRTPAVAVAAGSVVFVYRNLRPYLKFSLPLVPLSAAELDAAAALSSSSSSSSSTSSSSSSLLSSSAAAGTALPPAPPPRTHKSTVVTCMDVICRDREGETEPSSLVVGTEAAQLLFLEPSGAAVERSPVALPSVPALLVVHGTLKGEHRISVACRDGIVYAIKDRELTATRIEPPAMPMAIARTEALLYVASLDSFVTAFTPKGGKKAFSLAMPAPVTAMTRMLVRRERTADCVAVALEGGEVRVYNGATLVASLHMADTVVAMRFGQYGREANTLVLVSRAGSLTFKMLKRTASFEPAAGAAGASGGGGAAAGPPPEQDVPLAVPKKTRLYLELAQRESDASGDIYRAFQRDLVRLRLSTARAYARVLRDGLSVGDGGAASSLSARTGGGSDGVGVGVGIGGAAAALVQLRLACSVRGLGPRFKIAVDLMQSAQAGAPPLFNVSVALVYEAAIYHVERPLQVLPCMLPGVHYFPHFDVTCVDALGAANAVKVIVCVGEGFGGVPSATAVVNMPLSSI